MNPRDDSKFSIDVNKLPLAAANATHGGSQDATPEEVAMRLQKQKPMAAQHKDVDKSSRPADISVTSHPIASRRLGETSVSSSPPYHSALNEAMDVPRRGSSPFSGGASPHRHLQSASPRRVSPATSQIFERDVQEDTILAPELSPAIPSHIQTENHIPPVLEASSLAITDRRLDPDEVEIVTHASHQPAADTLAGNDMTESQLSHVGSQSDFGANTMGHEASMAAEEGSTYGAVDPKDPRRLSFISFADVVHAEHSEGGQNPLNAASAAASIRAGRSPSPMRSPISISAVPASPQTTSSFKGLENSPVRQGSGILSTSGTMAGNHGELSIETMSQALQKTGSTDFPPHGAPLSASDESAPEHSFR